MARPGLIVGWAGVAVLIELGSAACASSSSGSSCAGPLVDVSPQPVAAGSDAGLDGQLFFADCYDTNQVAGTPPPAKGIVMTFTQGELSQVLTTVDAARDGSLSATVNVPASALSGPATVTIGYTDVVVQVAAG